MALFRFGSNRIMFGGIFVLSKTVTFRVVTSGARLVGPVSMSPFVVSVVVTRLAKTVSGKPYGSTYIIGFNGWRALPVKLLCIRLVQQRRKLIVLCILVTVPSKAPLVLCIRTLTSRRTRSLTSMVV